MFFDCRSCDGKGIFNAFVIKIGLEKTGICITGIKMQV